MDISWLTNLTLFAMSYALAFSWHHAKALAEQVSVDTASLSTAEKF